MRAKTDAGIVTIQNEDGTDQSGCIASLNGGYFLKNQYLPANGVLVMSASSFSNSSDERFDVSAKVIASVSLECGDRFADVEF